MDAFSGCEGGIHWAAVGGQVGVGGGGVKFSWSEQAGTWVWQPAMEDWDTPSGFLAMPVSGCADSAARWGAPSHAFLWRTLSATSSSSGRTGPSILGLGRGPGLNCPGQWLPLGSCFLPLKGQRSFCKCLQLPTWHKCGLRG